ncbi:MAG: hypothetical protein AAB552_04090 [Patescibacteria group bacterium]
MDHIFEHYKKTGYFHHAHVLEGEHEVLVPMILSAVHQHFGIVAQGNPDVTVVHHESFGIDEARGLKEAETRAAFGGTRKIFIVSADSFTREAQNALLKTFEEPTEGTHFFIVIPRVDAIIATLKSRVVLVPATANKGSDDTALLAKKFLDASLEERFAMAKKLADGKDREAVRRMLDHIERILYTRLAGQKNTGDVFRDIYQTKTYLADRGSSVKMLLENLAIGLSAVSL